MSEKILVTGASGQLGHLVVNALLKSLSAQKVVAGARNTGKAHDLAARGVEVREVDYERPETLEVAFAGIDKVLLISSSEIGRRARQHRAVIEAAKKAKIKLLAYTSVLHADTSILGLAEEHRQTEQSLAASGVPSVILRNGWYTENYAASIPMAIEHGAVLGSAGEGRISSAARQDYAEAAAAVLVSEGQQAGKIYELAGDEAYTLTEFADDVARQSGKSIEYKDMPEEDYRKVLLDAGLPEPLAALLADSDTGASRGALFDDSHSLSQLIGRPTTPLAEVIASTLAS
jgi:NAD(P)H dehydrogenase (quinone)